MNEKTLEEYLILTGWKSSTRRYYDNENGVRVNLNNIDDTIRILAEVVCSTSANIKSKVLEFAYKL